MKKYGVKWAGYFPTGNYPDIFQIGTYKKMPALLHKIPVMLMNVGEGKLQSGRNCHIHGRSENVDGKDYVGFASAGCTVIKLNHNLFRLMNIVKQYYKDTDMITYTVLPMNRFIFNIKEVK